MTTTNRSIQFTNRARNTVARFKLGGIDYESTMDLLTEYAHRVRRMNSRVAGGNVAQATALDGIYALMEWLQSREPETFESQYGELLEPIGDGCYVTQPAYIDF